MSNPEMLPLVVAVTGSVPLASKVTTQLMRKLIRRGFRVRILRTPLGRLVPDGDIMLVPCQLKQVEELAQQLEQGWTENWGTWYSSSERQTKLGSNRKIDRQKITGGER